MVVADQDDERPGRVYTAAEAARLKGVGTKAITKRAKAGTLRAWPPHSAYNPTREWIVDADVVDFEISSRQHEHDDPNAGLVHDLEYERLRRREAEVELVAERAGFAEQRITQLTAALIERDAEIVRLRAALHALTSPSV